MSTHTNELQANALHATVPCAFCSTLNRVDMARVGDRPKCGSCGKPMLLDRPVRLSDRDLDRVIAASDVPILVDFYADWCAPCKIMAPLLDDLAREHAGRAIVGKLDTDRNPAMAGRFGISGIPTLIAFRDGQEHGRQVGAGNRQQLETLLAGAAG
jgi:thioredoxin 2